MVIELPEELEAAVKVTASSKGLSPELFVREVLERAVVPATAEGAVKPLKSGRGMWAKYGISLSAEDIDENRADMLRNFAEDF
jgi:plasmid stability protein